MSRKLTTLRALADEAELDYDLALVSLWDAGYEEFTDIDDVIPRRYIAGTHSALGIVPAKKMRFVTHWASTWGVPEKEARARLREYGISVGPNSRTLPKGSIKRLRRIGAISLSPSLDDSTVDDPPLEPAFTWAVIGRPRDADLLSSVDIRNIHDALVDDFRNTNDPIDPPGVRDENLLESAAFRAGTSLGGQRKYSSVELAAAALLHSIMRDHPFYNGNKRTALVSAIAFLDRNHVLLACSESDLFKLVLKISQHRLVPTSWSETADREASEVAKWILRNSRLIEHGDRLLKRRELRRVLSRFDCHVGSPMRGNKIRVQRTVQVKGILGLPKSRAYTAIVGYRSDGHEVDPTLLKYLRKELRLDDEHGFDSAYFYGTDPREPDEFIGQYRTLLKRLAKL